LLTDAPIDHRAASEIRRMFILDSSIAQDLFRAVYDGQTVKVSSRAGILRLVTRLYELGALEIRPLSNNPRAIDLRLTARPLIDLIRRMPHRDPENGLSKTIASGAVPDTTQQHKDGTTKG
jgi:hypothetical protein